MYYTSASKVFSIGPNIIYLVIGLYFLLIAILVNYYTRIYSLPRKDFSLSLLFDQTEPLSIYKLLFSYSYISLQWFLLSYMEFICVWHHNSTPECLQQSIFSTNVGQLPHLHQCMYNITQGTNIGKPRTRIDQALVLCEESGSWV